MIPKRQQIIEVLPSDPTWPAQFAAEADLITNIFKKEMVAIHHVHTFAVSSEHIDRHLYVRDYLIAHPQEAAQYAALKEDLAKQYPHNRRGYVEGKHDYILALEQRAIDWATHSSQL